MNLRETVFVCVFVFVNAIFFSQNVPLDGIFLTPRLIIRCKLIG